MASLIRHAVLVALLCSAGHLLAQRVYPWSMVRVDGGNGLYGTVVGASGTSLYFVTVVRAASLGESGSKEFMDIYLPGAERSQPASMRESFKGPGGYYIALYQTTVPVVKRHEVHRSYSLPLSDLSVDLFTHADITFSGEPGFDPQKVVPLNGGMSNGLLNLELTSNRASMWLEGMPVYNDAGQLVGIVADRWTPAYSDFKAVDILFVQQRLMELGRKRFGSTVGECAYFNLSDGNDGLSNCERRDARKREESLAKQAEHERELKLSGEAKRYLHLSKKHPVTLCLHAEAVYDEFCGWVTGGQFFLNPDGMVRIQARAQFSKWGSNVFFDANKASYIESLGIKKLHVTMASTEYAFGLEVGDGVYFNVLYGFGQQQPAYMRYEVEGSPVRLKVPGSEWGYSFWHSELGAEVERIRVGFGVRKIIGRNPQYLKAEVLNAIQDPVRPAEFIERVTYAGVFSISYRLHGWWSKESKIEALGKARSMGY